MNYRNRKYLLESSNIPLSILPVITYSEQIKLVYNTLNSVFQIENTKRQNLFFKILKQLKAKKFSEIFSLKSNRKDVTIWKYQRISFVYINFDACDIFLDLKLSVVNAIYQELYENRSNFVVLLAPKKCLIFGLSMNHYLIWSAVIRNLEYLFLTSILFDNKLLSQISDISRWKYLERTKINLKSFLIKLYKLTKKLNFTPTEYESSESTMYMMTILNVQNIFIERLALQMAYFNEISNINQLSEILDEISSFKNDTKSQLIVNKIIDNKPSKENELSIHDIVVNLLSNEQIEWILNINPLTFLEIFPLVNKESIYEDTGSFYTPINLAEILVNQSFSNFYSEKNSNFFLNIKILDPAMGTGIILIFTIEWLVNFFFKSNISLYNKKSFNNLRLKILNNCIYGNDLNKTAIDFSKFFFKFFYNLGMAEVNITLNFSNYDFLEKFVIQSNNLDLLDEFDLIISNPPYIAMHSRFTRYPLLHETISVMKNLIPQFSGKRDNLYLYFLGICLTYFIRENTGIIGFVIDAAFLDLPSYSRVREYLLKNFQINYILSDYSYKYAAVDLALIVIKNTQQTSQEILWQENVTKEIIKIKSISFLANPHVSFIHQNMPFYLNKIKNNSVPLGDICNLSCGLEYGSLLKTHFLSDKTNEGYFPVLDGANAIPQQYILFWIPNWANSYVKFDKNYEKWLIQSEQNVSPTKRRVLLISGDIDRFITPKIVLRQTASCFIAIYDDKQFFALRNLHIIYNPISPYSLKFLLGIINSSLGTWIGKKLNIIRTKGKNRYPQIRLTDLKRFPIINIKNLHDEQVQSMKSIENYVEEILIISQRVTLLLKELWNCIPEIERKFRSQKQFLKIYMNDYFKQEDSVLIYGSDFEKKLNELRNNITGIIRKQKKIDEEVFNLYRIDISEKDIIMKE